MSLKLESELRLDGAGFERGLEKATESVKEFVSRAVGIAAVSEAFLKAAEVAKEFANEVKDGADILGVTTDAYQKYAQAAAAGGTEMQTFMGAMDRLAKNQEDAKAGTEKAQQAFADFGLTMDDVREKTPTELFNAIAESIEKTGVNSKVTANLLELLGRSGSKLVPMMQDLKDAATKPVVNKEDLETVDALGKKFNSVKQELKGAVTTLAAQVASPVGFLSKFYEIAGGDQSAGIRRLSEKLQRQRADRGLDVETGKPLAESSGKSEAAAQRDAEAAGEINKKIQAEDEKRRQMGLSPELKRLELLRKIEDVEIGITQAKEKGASLSAIAERKLNLSQLKTELAAVKITTPKASAPRGDSLLSVGNFLGGRGAASISQIAQKQLEQSLKQTKHQENMAGFLKTISQKKGLDVAL